MLKPGSVRPHVKKGHSQFHPGISGLNPLTHRNTSYQPLPRPLGLPPYHYDLSDHFEVIAKHFKFEGEMVFDVLGDSGGVKDAEFQSTWRIRWSPRSLGLVPSSAITSAMSSISPVLMTIIIRSSTKPIRSTPRRSSPFRRNHDGEVDDPGQQTSLDGWVAYFMQANPDVDPISKDAPRVGLNLPNPYWTFVTPLATIVGMYTNVPEHSSIDSIQQQWLTNEFATADPDLPLILALHHPIYSFDVFHSGSAKMADALENAIRDTGRVPNLVLAGHVHDYQRIEQKIAPDGLTPFIVIGNGGYHNLHQIHSANGTVASDAHAKLIYDKVCWGYMTLAIDKKTISGQTTEIDRDGNVTAGDKFSYSAKPVTLKDPKSVPTL